MKTYKIYTLGCKVNQYDSGSLAAELELAGLARAEQDADIAVINSCAVTKTAMIKSGRVIQSARKENPKAKIILAGCLTRAGAKIRITGVDLVVKENNEKKSVEGIKSLLMHKDVREIVSPANAGLAMTDRARYFIKIQDGCEQYCTYCVIPYTRGKLSSRAESEVIAEIKRAVKAGFREIVLSGIHLGMYGKDLKSQKHDLGGAAGSKAKINLASLIKKLVKIKGLGRIRLSSIEITEVTDELIELIVKSDKICEHLHIPLQSGSDKILKLMNRPYDIKYFIDRIKRIRRAMPDIAITTDVIVGFPGETEKNFRETEKFIKLIDFSRLHVFPYSTHAKTPAAKFPGQVQAKIKARRAARLRKLGNNLAEDYKKKFKGRELEIIVERIKQNKINGKTEYYFEVELDKQELKNKNLRLGEIVKARC